MKGFKKLALVTAVAALPMSGFAMEALDDATMSGVTGQDGIAIGLSLNQTLNVLIDDTDGLLGVTGAPAAATGNGGIYISGMGMVGDANIQIDAGGTGTEGVLLVQVALDPGFALSTGGISVVDTDAGGGAFTAATGNILESMDITFASGLDLQLELGDAATQFLTLSGNAGSIVINNFVLNDLALGGAITADVVTISGLNLTGTTVGLDATDGLVVTTGAGLNAVGVSVTQLALGNGTAIGDVYISGLNMATQTITISGK